MSDYIKREDVKSALNGACVLYHTETIDRIPSADVVKVRHGRWLGGNNSLAPKCSVCGNWGQGKWNYCPCCGAKMDDESNVWTGYSNGTYFI